MALDELPAEILALIAEQLEAAGSPLAPFAATSKHFQAQVERVTFRSLVISDVEIDDFERVVHGPRFLALHCLHFGIHAVEGADGRASRVNIEALVARCEDAFTDSVRNLLTTLNDKTEDAPSHKGMHLILKGRCVPYRYDRIDDGNGRTRPAWVKLDENRFPKDLKASVIKEFYCLDENILAAEVWPSSWTTLLGRFPQLRKVHLKVYDNDRKDIISRREARNAFAMSLASFPPQLESLTLEYHGYPPLNQFSDPPCLEDAALGYDIFSHELGILSQRLASFELRNAILNLSDFFRANPNGTWPRLEKLELYEQQFASADGSWYFTLDSRKNIEEYIEEQTDPDGHTLDDMREYMTEDELPPAMDVPLYFFRTATDPTKFKEIYLAAADAAKRMPKLDFLAICFELVGDVGFGPAEHDFRFLAGQADWCKGSRTTLNAGWGLVPAIDIDSEVLEAWREVGMAKGRSISLLLREDPEFYSDFRLV